MKKEVHKQKYKTFIEIYELWLPWEEYKIKT